jgi:phosphoglycolate phosphatase
VAKSWNIAIKQTVYEREPFTENDIKSVMGLTMAEIADILFPDVEKEVRMALLDRCCKVENAYLYNHGGILYPKVKETMEELKKDYPLYIVSNCQSGYIEAFLEHYGFRKLVSDIECYGNNKLSKAENIARVCKRNGLDDAVYVGDIQGDYDSSVAAGVKFIHAAYGFGKINAEVPAIREFVELPECVRQIL